MNAKEEELVDWINNKLRYIDVVIQQAQEDSNYGKETQFKGMREAYQELLEKLNPLKEAAA